MHPRAAKELGELADKVEAGLIPECAIPRLFYFGHPVSRESVEFKPDGKPVACCVSCLKDWTVDGDHRKCPHCGDERPSWGHAIINVEHHTFWQCVDCQHEWEGLDGTKCPSCGSAKR